MPCWTSACENEPERRALPDGFEHVGGEQAGGLDDLGNQLADRRRGDAKRDGFLPGRIVLGSGTQSHSLGIHSSIEVIGTPGLGLKGRAA